jgi:hypothetical protein
MVDTGVFKNKMSNDTGIIPVIMAKNYKNTHYLLKSRPYRVHSRLVCVTTPCASFRRKLRSTQQLNPSLRHREVQTNINQVPYPHVD